MWDYSGYQPGQGRPPGIETQIHASFSPRICGAHGAPVGLLHLAPIRWTQLNQGLTVTLIPLPVADHHDP